MTAEPRNDAISEPPSAREIEVRLLAYRKAFAELMHSDALRGGDVVEALRLVTEVAAHILRVERASVWLFTRDREALQCKVLYEHTAKRHSEGLELPAARYPSYFAALWEERCIAAHDARTDPRTREFSESYLTSLGIHSMLDAPVFVRGQMVGVVCHEHVGGKRHWDAWEEIVAGSIADFVALALESAQRNVDEQKLTMYTQHLESLVAERTLDLTRLNHELVTESAAREAIQARLRTSEQNLRTLFEISPVVIVLSRLSDQSVLLSNRRASELFEVPLEEATGKKVLDFYVDPEDRARFAEQIKRWGTVDGFESRLRTASGRVFPALLSGQLLQFEGEAALLVSAVDMTQQKKVEAQLRELATLDALTGCFNRRHFLELGSTEVERAARYSRPVSVAMMDADHFKNINDCFGHAEGDRALRAIAEACRRTMRKSDVFGRFGGEEFIVLFVETELEPARLATERMLAEVAALTLEHEGVPIPLTLSAGVAERRDNETLEALIKRADDALYLAKKEGRNRVVSAM
jgi:diguanylate cyclase (GGDEF)-like protein/PAS domain S-box-containing protein